MSSSDDEGKDHGEDDEEEAKDSEESDTEVGPSNEKPTQADLARKVFIAHKGMPVTFPFHTLGLFRGIISFID